MRDGGMYWTDLLSVHQRFCWWARRQTARALIWSENRLDLIRSEWTSLTDPPLHGPMNVKGREKSGCQVKRCMGREGKHTSTVLKQYSLQLHSQWQTISEFCWHGHCISFTLWISNEGHGLWQNYYRASISALYLTQHIGRNFIFNCIIFLDLWMLPWRQMMQHCQPQRNEGWFSF